MDTNTEQDKTKKIKRKLSKKQHIIRLTLNLIIVGCLLTAGYLYLKPYLRHRAQDSAANDLRNKFNNSADGKVEMSFDAGQYRMPDDGAEDFQSASQTEPPESFKVSVIADLAIPSIDLNMPIADNANTNTLWVAIGHYQSSVGFGEPGNSVLFGHRMYSYGRFFNRLNEVKVGQKIVIKTKAKTFNYTVSKTVIIPKEKLAENLFSRPSKHQLILVTCDPLRYSGSGPTPDRILVFASLDNP